ncbi:MAG: DUF2914 domain-containing protein [Fibrobacteraceae bacterium]|nr:DUF2914 domain-containing protein [Fibrobacteraceae bacterium]
MAISDKVTQVREKPLVKKIEKFAPAICFLGGFLWDSVTLGSMVQQSDLIFLLAYYAGAFILVILLSAQLENPQGYTTEVLESKGVKVKASSSKVVKVAGFAKKVGLETDNLIPENAVIVKHRFLDREWSSVWKSRISWAVQFCFGSLFSALVVCYFKSSGSIGSLILVLIMVLLLVGNEFLQKRYESFGVSLAFFCLLGTMFLNFAIPHLVHRMGFIWFLLSSLLSFGICYLIWKISHRSKKNLIAPIAITVLLVVAYIMNWVPPVPLVLKQQVACIQFEKEDYSCNADAPSLLQKVGLKSPSVHKNNDTELYFLSAIYAPMGVQADLEHRWYYKSANAKDYMLTDRISTSRMRTQGSRVEGFRIFTRKKNAPAGSYRVETAFKDGAVIGAQAFDVVEGALDSTGYAKHILE